MPHVKITGLLLLIVAAFLLYFGFNQADSAVEKISETLTGKYSDETMSYLIGGVVAACIGLYLVIKRK
ncbi:MAG: DUF3185 family protein [Paraglaciecola sp.]|uniref:DUF3185 family protein n=1 Tax=Pseudomonadati TaxID=3379134 RepID=UPI00273EA5E0|nr:DUF3185 family protein [Paraglaciecola sp.]MDP5029995.1 DUF3185 family protein [Paraglaciecola sp.]MDP5041668.1 DUF3185 family protein [Paraglaciecola sp.]MDP5130841.1 DUF3185 family protein [Paraglaciecola sp.]